MPAGTENPLDAEPEYLHLSVHEMHQVPMVGSMGAALADRTAERAHLPVQGMFGQAFPKQGLNG